MGFLEWLQFSPLGSFVAESLWAYPVFETLHVMGMAMLVGVLGLTNLRVLGYKRELPLIGTRELLPLAWLGFTVNLMTLLALVLAIGLVVDDAIVLSRGIFREVAEGSDVALPPSYKFVAASSLVFWLGAILAGRLVAYLP